MYVCVSGMCIFRCVYAFLSVCMCMYVFWCANMPSGSPPPNLCYFSSFHIQILAWLPAPAPGDLWADYILLEKGEWVSSSLGDNSCLSLRPHFCFKEGFTPPNSCHCLVAQAIYLTQKHGRILTIGTAADIGLLGALVDTMLSSLYVLPFFSSILMEKEIETEKNAQVERFELRHIVPRDLTSPTTLAAICLLDAWLVVPCVIGAVGGW